MAFEVDGIFHIRLNARGELNSRDPWWDDGAGGQIKKIFLWHDDSYIYGIQTIYERKGAKLISKIHGGTQGNLISINPRRPLTWVSGHYGRYCLDPEMFIHEEDDSWNYLNVITSLKFGNNEETYGPFGCAQGTPFVYRPTAEITGFHGFSTGGTSSEFGFISAIGFYIKTDAVGVVEEPSMSSTKSKLNLR